MRAVASCYLFEKPRRGQLLPSSQVETTIESAVEVDAGVGRKPSRSERSADQLSPAECALLQPNTDNELYGV